MTEPQTLEEAKRQLAQNEVAFENCIDIINYLHATITHYKYCIYSLAIINIVTVIALMLKIHMLQNAM